MLVLASGLSLLLSLSLNGGKGTQHPVQPRIPINLLLVECLRVGVFVSWVCGELPSQVAGLLHEDPQGVGCSCGKKGSLSRFTVAAAEPRAPWSLSGRSWKESCRSLPIPLPFPSPGPPPPRPFPSPWPSPSPALPPPRPFPFPSPSPTQASCGASRTAGAQLLWTPSPGACWDPLFWEGCCELPWDFAGREQAWQPCLPSHWD